MEDPENLQYVHFLEFCDFLEKRKVPKLDGSTVAYSETYIFNLKNCIAGKSRSVVPHLSQPLPKPDDWKKEQFNLKDSDNVKNFIIVSNQTASYYKNI